MHISNQQVLDRVRDHMAYRRYGVSYADAEPEQRQAIDSKIARPVTSVDGAVLVHGETRVFTTNLDRGVVDLSRLDYEWHAGENRWVPWFDVNCDIDYKGNTINRCYSQSDDRVATRFEGRSA
jgi:hypothetical protein